MKEFGVHGRERLKAWAPYLIRTPSLANIALRTANRRLRNMLFAPRPLAQRSLAGSRALWTLLTVLTLFGLVCAPETFGQKKGSSKQAKKDFKRAYKLMQKSGTREVGVSRLLEFRDKHAGDPLVDKVEAVLLDFGVGEEVEVILADRKKFRKLYQVKDSDVLENAEKNLEDLREFYGAIKKPFFKTADIKLHFYDSRARYRKITGLITAGGNFAVKNADRSAKSLTGEIHWFFPQGTNVRNRDVQMQSLLYHELSHYLNTIYFGNHVLPPLFEEGIAVYMETRLNTELNQNQRSVRELRESAARNALGSIKKYKDFIAFLNSERGFGRGDLMISRWYGMCYGVMDFLIHGKLNDRETSIKEFLLHLSSWSSEVLKKKSPGLNGEKLLELQIERFFGSNLRKFHKGLLKHVQSFRQI